MIYSNPEFIILFSATLGLYSLFNSYRSRFLILLTASILFYLWAGVFDGIVFLFVILMSWLAAALGERYPAAKNRLISLGIVLLAAHLLFWKYAPWIISQVQYIYPSFWGGRALFLPLPLGISFFTLQSIAYLVDYSRGQAEFVGLPTYALFKSFFAQLLAGPIVRGSQLFSQLKELKKPTESDVSLGLTLFVLGFFKKTAVANRVALFVDTIFAAPDQFGRVILAKALLGYAVQIWADFSGYTDMGRGAALMVGIRLPENFLSPYLAKTPSEFWRRWHITLSEWIKDYLFTPLALTFRRLSVNGIFYAAVITMLIAGLWHGAGWNFLLFGIYHGALLVFERKLRILPDPPESLAPLWSGLQTALLFSLVLLGWLLFRLESMDLLWAFLKGLALDSGVRQPPITGRSIYWGLFFCFFLQGLCYYDFRSERWVFLAPLKEAIARKKIANPAAGLCAGALLAAVFTGAILLRPPRTGGFIYFQF